MASGIVAHWEAKGTDIIGDNYTYIVRPELGDYMTLPDYRGKTVTSNRLHDSCLDGSHYFAYLDAPSIGPDHTYFLFIKESSFVTVTDLTTGANRKEGTLHEKCRGGDFYLATSKYHTWSSSPVFIIIFAKSGTFRAVSDLNSGKPFEYLQYDGREEYNLHPSCQNGLYYWSTKSFWSGEVWYYIVKGVDRSGRMEFHYTKDLCTDEEGATECFEPTVVPLLSGIPTVPSLNPWTGDGNPVALMPTPPGPWPPTEGYLTTKDLGVVQTALVSVLPKWFQLGIDLGLRYEDLKLIEYKYKNEVERCLPEMIAEWLKRAEPKATWGALVSALKKPTTDEEGVATDITEMYLSSPDS